MTLLPEDIVKILVAVLIGGLIGAEREYRDKVAGFRTLIFICVGATLFTIFSLKLGGDRDPVRIASNIVSGVGFLGAGAILQKTGRITGLTTASMIWLAAALGLGIGGGHFLLCGVAGGVVLIVLLAFPKSGRWIDNAHRTRTYEVVTPVSTELLEEIKDMIIDCGLRVGKSKRVKADDEMINTWIVYGSPHGHDVLVEKLFAHPQVKRFQA
jgi:putative Mg2+ transporter-C (MgtC) family protein